MDIAALLNADDPGDLADAIMELFDALDDRVSESGADDLDPAVRVAYLALLADSAMNNDGPSELLDGEATIPPQAVVDALDALGAAKLADLLARGLVDPANTRLLDEWSRYPDDLESLITDWVSEHEDEFRAA